MKTISSLLTALILLALTACRNDAFEPQSLTALPPGAIALDISVKGETLISTRASQADEDKIHNLTVAIYDPANSFALIEALDARPVGTQWYIRPSAWDPATTEALIVAVVNLDPATLAAFKTADGDDGQHILTTSLTADPVVDSDHGIPMASEIITYSAGSGAITGGFIRLYAKISVDAAAAQTSPTFTLSGATLWNGAKKGKIGADFSTTDITPNNGGTLTYTEVAATANATQSLIYLHENNGALATQAQGTNPTKLIIRGTYDGTDYYYPIHIAYGTPGALEYNIVRNTHYMVNITRVKGAGYASAADAADAPRSNAIDYTITIPSNAGGDAVGDGNAYIAVDYSEIILHQDGIIAPTWLNKIMYKGIGTGTFSTTAVTGSLTATGAITGNTFTANTTTDQSQGIMIGMDAAFTTGEIIIRLGTLEKRITVRRLPAIRPWQSEVDTYGNPHYLLKTIFGNVLGGLEFRYATAQTTYAGATQPPVATTVALSEPISAPYFYASPFKLKTTGESSQYVLLDKTAGQHILLRLTQEVIAAFTPLSNFYVGAFWRNTQTGERLIRQEGAAYNGDWEAGVCEGLGAEWARLDPNGVPGTMPGDEAAESSPVNTTTALTGAGNIKFRIGLTGDNPNSADIDYPLGKPRYGLVIVRYLDVDGITPKYSPIYLRQGEEADYVDGPYAKWSPYNLGEYNTSATYANNGFVAYPSQAGAFRQWSTYTGNLYPPYGIVTWQNEAPYNMITNSCPAGYSIPTCNETRTVSAANQYGTLFQTDGTNGHYADGFFDRYTIEHSSSILYGTTYVGYTGKLIYNSTTQASLFLPTAGARDQNNGGNIFNNLTHGYYWSSSYTSNAVFVLFNTATVAPLGYSPSAPNLGCSIRCVR